MTSPDSPRPLIEAARALVYAEEMGLDTADELAALLDAARSTSPDPALATPSEPTLDAHEPGEFHRYTGLVCEVCGVRGQVVVSVEPQRETS